MVYVLHIHTVDLLRNCCTKSLRVMPVDYYIDPYIFDLLVKQTTFIHDEPKSDLEVRYLHFINVVIDTFYEPETDEMNPNTMIINVLRKK